jgi:hypothetical protein
MAVKRRNTQPTLDLDGPGGNVFAVMGFTADILRQLGVDQAYMKSVRTEMMSKDYLNALKVADREIGMFVMWETDNEEYLNVLKS